MTTLDAAIVVALGSNLSGDFASVGDLLEAALDRLGAEGLEVVRRSSWWRSAAWPDPTAPAYLNGVAIVETGLNPLQVLALLRRVEGAFGRRRGEPNAPRTLDLDLVAHGRTLLRTGDLVLPHPRAADRLFVMGPLAEIAPDWRHPETGETADLMARRTTVGLDAAPVI